MAATADHAALRPEDAPGTGSDAGEREMRDLEELLSKLNPMAEEFVPPSLASSVAGGPAALAPVPALLSPPPTVTTPPTPASRSPRRRTAASSASRPSPTGPPAAAG